MDHVRALLPGAFSTSILCVRVFTEDCVSLFLQDTAGSIR